MWIVLIPIALIVSLLVGIAWSFKDSPDKKNEGGMSFKEFIGWCNDRAADGCWGRDTAVACLDIMRIINSLPQSKRERYWRDNFEEWVRTNVVEPLDKARNDIYEPKSKKGGL